MPAYADATYALGTYQLGAILVRGARYG